MLQNIFLFQINIVPLNFLFITESWNLSQFQQKYSAAQLFSTLIINRNVSWAVNHHIIIITEGSYDTEDWSNDAEYSALITEINYILLKYYIKIIWTIQ